MSKRYSGKSFSSVKKKPRLTFKEKEKLREKSEKTLGSQNIYKYYLINMSFFKFSKEKNSLIYKPFFTLKLNN